MKQSLCYPIYVNGSGGPDQLCARAKQIGFAAIEFWGWQDGYEEVVKIAKENGLEISSFTGHESIDHGFNDLEQHDRIIQELEESIERAALFDVPGVIGFSGARLGNQSDLEGLVTAAKGLRRIAPIAEAKGVNINIEILNSRVDHPGYLCDRVDWGIALCEMVGSSRVKLLFDIYHVQIMEGDIIRNLRQAMPYIGHLHTAGNPGRNELDTGEMNYREICRVIRDLGYEGYLGHEFFPKNSDQLKALEDAYHLCA
jgi:hydroxypyruvate isomerase